MRKRKWIGKVAGLVVIGSVIGLCTLLFLEDDNSGENETELPNGRILNTDVPLSNQVDDLNDDGEYNILDLVLEINSP